jgi:hypothetical protein
VFTATPTPTRTPTPSPTPTPAPNTYQLIDADLARNAITRDQAATYKMYALFGARSQVPAQYIGTEPVPGDGTMLFLEAMKDWDRLSPATKTLINDFITPKEITDTVPLTLVQPAAQPTRVATPSNFPRGTFHIHGALTGITGNQLQVVTERGATDIAIQTNSILRLGNQNVTVAQLQIGDTLDGLIQVDARGQTIAIHFAVIRATRGTGETNLVSPQIAATSSARWSPAVNLASGTGWSSAPTVATDQQNNLYVAWAADGPPAGLRVWYQRGSASATVPIPNTSATDRNPALTMDGQGNAHLAWEGPAGERSQIFYARGTWGGATPTLTWTNPITISPVISTGINNAYLARIAATTWNGEPQLHVLWMEMYNPVPGVWTYRQMYRQWRAWTNQWLAPVVLNENAIFSGNPTLAIAPTGRVGVTFYESIAASWRVRYRECNLVSANGNCSDAARWTNVETVAPSTGANPHLAFDAGSNAHIVWGGSASNGAKTIGYSTKPVTSTQWLTATVLGTSSLEMYPVIGSGTPNHLYAVWGAGAVNFRQWDGQQWLASATLDQPTGYGQRWGALVMDSFNRAHVVWQSTGGEIWYAVARQTATEIGLCGLTEYYDTQNFRIYYTRTYPNLRRTSPTQPREEDCRIRPPIPPRTTPPPADAPVPMHANGYPYFVTLLGEGLEQSRTQYKILGYPVLQIQPLNARHPIYVTSDPIWTDLPVIGNWIPMGARGLSLPDHLFINRTVAYTTTQTFPLDPLRGEVANHELFHALQWTYVPSACRMGGQLCNWGTQEELRWWMEATARWAEPKAYTQSASYPMWLDNWLGEPYRSMVGPGRKADAAVLFARYLEDKVAKPRDPANAHTIIQKTWQVYSDTRGSNMLTAIDQTLQRSEYGTTLANEFPEFTWNNYFMITGTYDTVLPGRVYADLYDPFNTNRQMVGFHDNAPEWQVFRNRLVKGRENYAAGNVGVLVDRVNIFPVSSITSTYSTRVENMGAGYIEFLPNPSIGANGALSVTFSVNLPLFDANRVARISVLPINNFINLPHPGNVFLVPRVAPPPSVLISQYTFEVANFGQCDRVTLIANAVTVTTDVYDYSYLAQVHTPVGPPSPSPCLLVLP